MKKSMKKERVFTTKKVSDEVFAFISASCSILTEHQTDDKSICLCANMWRLYHELGGHERFRSAQVRNLENELTKRVF